MPTWVVDVAGTRSKLVAAPAVTVSVAVALVNPGADTVMVALPVVVAVKLDTATPPVEVTGEAGLKVPATPLAANVTGTAAVPTVLPLAS